MEKTLNKETDYYHNLINYYSTHAYIYDFTRWSFLFGRNTVIKNIPLSATEVKNVIEIGCGTGKNLKNLAKRFPNSNVIGVDISEDMLQKAKQHTRAFSNIELLGDISHLKRRGDFDVVLFSYVFTMMNPGWENALEKAYELLSEDGYLVVVDFHTSKYNWFRKHMGNHHVKMEAHILPKILKKFNNTTSKVQPVYLGLWEYFTFIGKKIRE